ncbi:toll/interleukin-1 receptor domain-containing protein [Terricaulis sp.]|uniref:toll/interleukin-1 receptor domain-containing protein n=1 Tax=Terricaulis sp. TaxID=2768686 RepID=UPI003783D418
MTDVFISYAHEDQAFVRRLAQALEGEGFSVWWDHTIPPGKTWNTYIARGIAEAKACIVVWSKHSVASKWVLEEATLANNGEKLLPVSVDASPPPMGFLSVQAAQLAGWSGDVNNAQWRLLVREVREIVNASPPGETRAPRQSTSYAPPSPPAKKNPPWAIFGIVGAVAAIGVFAVILNAMKPAPDTEAGEQTTTATTSSTGPAADPAASDSASEIERLRRERDEAEERALRERTAREAAERSIAQQQTQTQQPRTQQAQTASLVGSWSFHGEGCWGDARIDFASDGTFRESSGLVGHWRQTASNIWFKFDTSLGTEFQGVMNGNSISGQISVGGDCPFTGTRT